MAGRITEYPNSVTTLTNGDLFDVSDYDEISAYESKSLTWANLLTNIESQGTFDNLYTTDGSISGNRTITEVHDSWYCAQSNHSVAHYT